MSFGALLTGGLVDCTLRGCRCGVLCCLALCLWAAPTAVAQLLLQCTLPCLPLATGPLELAGWRWWTLAERHPA